MKTKRNKKYVPRPASPFAGLVAIQRNQIASQERRPMTDERQINVLIAYCKSIDAMTSAAWAVITSNCSARRLTAWSAPRSDS